MHFKDTTTSIIMPTQTMRGTWEVWKTIFLDIANMLAPLRIREVKSEHCPWMTNEIKNLAHQCAPPDHGRTGKKKIGGEGGKKFARLFRIVPALSKNIFPEKLSKIVVDGEREGEGGVITKNSY
jgi:hypothetical protein